MSKLKVPFKSLIRNAAGDDRESLKGKLVYGIFWNLISALASQGFPMIAAIIAARLLGKFGYGQLGMINSTVILFSTFAGLGLGITATKVHSTATPDRSRTNWTHNGPHKSLRASIWSCDVHATFSLWHPGLQQTR